MISDHERKFYYRGISSDPPVLIWRSDFFDKPFPVPEGRFGYSPTKTAHGVFNTRLNEVWHTVVPLIITELKKHLIRYSAITSARFSNMDEDENETLGPIVLWIATPSTTTTEDARHVTPVILRILEDHQVKEVVVEWYEGTVEKLSAGQSLMRKVPNCDPTHYVRRMFTASLCIPITPAEMQYDNVEGSLGFFFHENRTKDGKPSDRVLGVSTDHVLRKDTTVDYEFHGPGAPRQYVRLAGLRRYQRCLSEIKHIIGNNISEAKLLALNIVTSEEMPRSQKPEVAAKDEKYLERIRGKLVKLNEETASLEEFYRVVISQWSDIECRGIGHIDWAPKISVDVNGSCYTNDIATFELNKSMFKEQFKGNVVDLGAFISSFSSFNNLSYLQK